MAKPKRKHRYPKTRKNRNTKYSTTWKILEAIGKDRLYAIWKDHGNRQTSRILTDMLDLQVTPMVIQYIAARKFKWVRVITDKNLPLYRGILSGKLKPEQFKTLIFN